MQLQNPFAALTSSLDGVIIESLARANGDALDAAALARLSGRSYAGVRKAVDRLVRQGTITATSVGRIRLYSFNTEHLLAPMIQQIVHAREEFLLRLSRMVEEVFRVQPAYAAVFGSAAREEMREDSDIDLFFLRPAAADDDEFEHEAHELALRASRLTGNEGTVVIYGEDEIDGAMKHERVLDEVARDGLTFAGTGAEFRRRIRNARAHGQS